MLTGKQRDCFQQLAEIGEDAKVHEAEKVTYLTGAIRAKNTDMVVGLSSVKSDMGPDGKASNYEKAVSFLKNCVEQKRTTNIRLAALDVDHDQKIADQKAEIKSLTRKLKGGKGKGDHHKELRDKFYGDDKLSGADKKALACRGYSGQHWRSLGRKLQGSIMEWRKEFDYKPDTPKGGRNEHTKSDKKRKIAAMKTQLKALKKKLESKDDGRTVWPEDGCSHDGLHGGQQCHCFVQREAFQNKTH